MTVVATVVAGDMRRVFARCCKTVMTGAAATQHLCVIDRIDGSPHIAVVTILTDVARLHMRQVFAGSIQAVVAACAIARNIHVVECRRSPGDRRVAIVAGIAAREVRWVLTSCNYAIVTGATGADDLGMVDAKHGRKYVGVMAVLANVAGLNMRKVLADGIHAVMAVNAATGDIQMIEIRWEPCHRRMTVVTGFAAGDMRRVLAGCCDAVMT